MEDFDHQIGFWIEDISYIYLQNSKNILNTARVYLIYPQCQGKNSNGVEGIFERFVYSEDDKIKWNDIDIYNIETLPNIINAKDCFSVKDNYHKLFRRCFSAWDLTDIYKFFDFQYVDQYDIIDIRIYKEKKVNILYNVKIENSKPVITLNKNAIKGKLFDQQLFSINTNMTINRDVIEKPPILLKAERNFLDKKDDFSIYNRIVFFSFKDHKGELEKFKISSYGNIGERPTMEDESIFCEIGNCYMFAVLDGHGGSFGSEYFGIDIPKKLLDFVDKGKITEDNIKEAFVQSSKNLYLKSFFLKGGTCFTGVLITPNNIFVINLGDSRTLLIEPEMLQFSKPKPLFITKDHKPYFPEETERINSLKKNKDAKIIIGGRIKGQLAISRSLGDFDLNTDPRDLSFTPFVSYIPDVNVFKRIPGMHIIISCDGIYDVLNEEVILSIYKKNYMDEKINVSRKICEAALINGTTDNVSVITIELK